MKPKSDSWNNATAEAARGEPGVRKSLTRAGLQLSALTHVVSGALHTLQGGSNARASAQNRMKALLNQDRALLSHRPYAQANLVDEPEVASPTIPRKGSQTRGAAQNRMRELLNQDRAMLAFRAREGLEDDEDLDELLEFALRGGPQSDSLGIEIEVDVETSVVPSSRASCTGATTSFAPEEVVSSVCTPGPLAPPAKAEVPVGPVSVGPVAAAPIAAAPVVKVVPAVPPAAAPVAQPKAVELKVVEAPAAPAVKSEEPASDPIRTRGMAKLLAMQGYKDRALSIYDELIAAEPNNAELRAEADKLRSH